MKKFIIIATILCQFINALAQSQNEEASQLLEELISENIVMGIAAGYAIDGKTKWQAAIGYANQKMEEKYRLHTTTRGASIAKSMTATATMQLIEQGLIDLDRPIQDYIPDFPHQSNVAITVRHLLSHTSGIDGYKNAKEAETTANYSTLRGAVDVFKDRALLFEPGSRYSYTTYGYVVLGLIIEKVSSLTFEQYMQNNIWDRAEMHHTGVEKFKLEQENKSSLYHRSKNGKIKEGNENNLSNRIPGGGFYTTLDDMLKFGNAILDHSLVKQSTFELMTQHHSLEKETNAYGFGWFLYGPKPNEGVIIGHGGAQTGASSQLFIIPKTKTLIMVLSNTSGTSKQVSTLAGELIGLSQKNK